MNLSMITLMRALAIGLLLAVWWPVLMRPHASVLPSLIVSGLVFAALVWHAHWLRAGRLTMIRRHPLPSFLRQKLLRAHPLLSDAALRDVERGLRQFFNANAQAEGRFVAMPSKVVDTLWHEFILHTRGYEVFCHKAFGRLLHHTPAEALPATTGGATRNPIQHEGLRRAWYWACREEGIDPRKPSRLPLLFSLDATLGIVGGYVYALDCAALGADRRGTHCAGDLSSGCGGGGSGGEAGGGDGDGGGGCGGD